MRRVFHRIEVIEIAEDSSKPCTVGRNSFRSPGGSGELASGVAHPFSACAIVTACAGRPMGEPAWPTVVMPSGLGNSPVMKLGAARRATRFRVVIVN